jgi:hypothetical protein
MVKDCDLCKRKFQLFGKHLSYSDAYLPSYRTWGNVCDKCATAEQVKYGTGLGQRYEWDSSAARYVKTKG